MDLEGTIFNVLEGNGLDKRFRNNPQAVLEITEIVQNALGGVSLDGFTPDELRTKIQSVSRKIIDENGNVVYGTSKNDPSYYQYKDDGTKYVRSEARFLKIDKKGTLKSITRSIDCGRTLNLEKKEIALVGGFMMQNREYNHNGLEMKFQQVDSVEGIAYSQYDKAHNLNDIFGYVPDRNSTFSARKNGPISMLEISRGDDLVTQRVSAAKWPEGTLTNCKYVSVDKWPEGDLRSLRSAFLTEVNHDEKGIETTTRIRDLKRPYLDASEAIGTVNRALDGKQIQLGGASARIEDYKVAVACEPFTSTLLEEAKYNPSLAQKAKSLGIAQPAVGVTEMREIYQGR